MEALGAAAAILQLIELTIKTTSKLYSSYSSLKAYKSTRGRLAKEMRDLMRVLDQLLDITSVDGTSADTTKKRHAQALEQLFGRGDSILGSCNAEIQTILGLLEGSKLSWLQRQKQIESHLGEIERCKQQLGLAVQTQSM
jgi:hypothetical protein